MISATGLRAKAGAQFLKWIRTARAANALVFSSHDETCLWTSSPLLVLTLASHFLCAQEHSATPTSPPVVPAWAQPGSATHTQTAPPPDFHRPSKNFDTPIGNFEGQSDIGSAVISGSASYDAATMEYTVHSAGYNIWYMRDEFRYLWRKLS